MDLNTRVSKRITNSSAIDVSASFSPDGKSIVFNSDRSGYQQIYIMRSDGSNGKRRTCGKDLDGTLVGSPRSNLIALTKVHQGKFYIGVMSADGSGERVLSDDFDQ